MKTIIALIGLSGSGKTSVARSVADTLGWSFIDTDQQIEQQTGHSITELFGQWGEPAFRAKEREVLENALAHNNAVIATGGGVVEDTHNRELLRQRAFIVWLHAPVPTLVERLGTTNDRPLLSQAPESRLTHLGQRRAPFYTQLAEWIVATQLLSPHQVTQDILRGYRLAQQAADDTLRVVTPGGDYPIILGPDALNELPAQLDQAGVGARLWLVSDSHVLPLHGEHVQQVLRDAGRSVRTSAIPAGEQHKTQGAARALYDWLLSNGVERGDTILALGGGVVGDVAGFVAATVLRGIALVQLPTTILAMVDSAIGGKTGVDHPQGKNLIGAFWQPRLVLADTTLLQTLPAQERTAGWAEVIKHAVIGDAALFADLQQHSAATRSLDEPITSELLRRAAAFKAGIVSGDEREHGQRILLNYGHTVGHAIETASNYTIRHGEAVAIGMMAAGTLAAEFGLFADADLAAQRALLEDFGLPTRIPPDIDTAQVMQRMVSDKKTQNARLRWVLPTAIGQATVRDNVPANVVATVLEELQDS